MNILENAIYRERGSGSCESKALFYSGLKSTWKTCNNINNNNIAVKAVSIWCKHVEKQKNTLYATIQSNDMFRY